MLLDLLCSEQDVELGSRHVRWLPCEDVLVHAQEVDEHAFLFAEEAGANLDHLVGVLGVDLDHFGVLGGLESPKG